MEKTVRFSVPFPQDLHKRFKLWCVSNDVKMVDAIRDLVERDLDRREIKAAKGASRLEVQA